jgi:hypothetical protein
MNILYVDTVNNFLSLLLPSQDTNARMSVCFCSALGLGFQIEVSISR